MPELTCSYCMVGKVELSHLPTECPACGKTLERPVKAVERFAGDPEKLMAGLALENEKKLPGAQAPSVVAASIPVYNRDGTSWTREQAAATVLHRIQHDMGALSLVPVESDEYASAMGFLAEQAKNADAEVEVVDEDDWTFRTIDSVCGRSAEMYLLVFEVLRS